MNDMYVFWMRIVPSVPSEINCLTKIHDVNALYEQFWKYGLCIEQCLLAIEKTVIGAIKYMQLNCNIMNYY